MHWWGITKELLFPWQGGLSSVAYVKVDLVDINDNRPTFYPVIYAVSLSTQSAPGTSVVRVMAYDPDSGENGRIAYKTAPGGASPYFTLNKDTGLCQYFPNYFPFAVLLIMSCIHTFLRQYFLIDL